jgi:transposase-like protein
MIRRRCCPTRGLAAPRLVVADGAPGLISAVEEIWPRADRQHCAVHRLRNLQAKLPKSEHDRIRFNYWSALTDATSVKDGKLRLKVLISELEHGGYESAARCLSDDLDALVVHLRYPLRHRERWRSTNLLERSLGEVRRRTKVMGRFPGETSCLSLVWAVLDLFFSHAMSGRLNDRQGSFALQQFGMMRAGSQTLDWALNGHQALDRPRKLACERKRPPTGAARSCSHRQARADRSTRAALAMDQTHKHAPVADRSRMPAKQQRRPRGRDAVRSFPRRQRSRSVATRQPRSRYSPKSRQTATIGATWGGERPQFRAEQGP